MSIQLPNPQLQLVYRVLSYQLPRIAPVSHILPEPQIMHHSDQDNNAHNLPWDRTQKAKSRLFLGQAHHTEPVHCLRSLRLISRQLRRLPVHSQFHYPRISLLHVTKGELHVWSVSKAISHQEQAQAALGPHKYPQQGASHDQTQLHLSITRAVESLL